MRYWFKQADRDGTKMMGKAEFKRLFHDVRTRAYFKTLDIDFTSAEKLFQLIDKSHTGQISMEDFVEGIISLQGPAKRVDISEVKYLCETMMSRIKYLERAVAFDGSPSVSPLITTTGLGMSTTVGLPSPAPSTSTNIAPLITELSSM